MVSAMECNEIDFNYLIGESAHCFIGLLMVVLSPINLSRFFPHEPNLCVWLLSHFSDDCAGMDIWLRNGKYCSYFGLDMASGRFGSRSRTEVEKNS